MVHPFYHLNNAIQFLKRGHFLQQKRSFFLTMQDDSIKNEMSRCLPYSMVIN